MKIRSRHELDEVMSLLVYSFNINDQQQLEDDFTIPKATVDILKDQVFGCVHVIHDQPRAIEVST
jgi:hypothetical protein